jgi:uncharacterized protein (TIGR02611 family)
VATGKRGGDSGREQPQSDRDEEHAATILHRVNQRVAGLRASVARRPGGARAWRIGVAFAGSVVIAAGVVLLVIPGPGWLVIFLGLGIWATEYAWARSLLDFAQRQVRKWTAWVARQPRWLAVAVGAAALLAVAVVVWFWLA